MDRSSQQPQSTQPFGQSTGFSSSPSSATKFVVPPNMIMSWKQLSLQQPSTQRDTKPSSFRQWENGNNNNTIITNEVQMELSDHSGNFDLLEFDDVSDGNRSNSDDNEIGSNMSPAASSFTASSQTPITSGFGDMAGWLEDDDSDGNDVSVSEYTDVMDDMEDDDVSFSNNIGKLNKREDGYAIYGQLICPSTETVNLAKALRGKGKGSVWTIQAKAYLNNIANAQLNDLVQCSGAGGPFSILQGNTNQPRFVERNLTPQAYATALKDQRIPQAVLELYQQKNTKGVPFCKKI